MYETLNTAKTNTEWLSTFNTSPNFKAADSVLYSAKNYTQTHRHSIKQPTHDDYSTSEENRRKHNSCGGSIKTFKWLKPR